MKRFTISTLLSGVFFLTSCNNFLNQEPLDQLSPNEYLTTESNIAAFVTDQYQVLPTHGTYGYGTFEIDNNTDNMAGMQPNVMYAPGYWKVGQGDNQAVSASLRYFSLGEVTTSGLGGAAAMTVNPYELSLDMGYSRKLSEKFSMGVVFRYIYSALGVPTSESESQMSGASAFAADIAGYYTTYPVIGRNECQWSWGWNLSNIGSKVNYDGGNDPAFLPAQLRLGTSFTFPLADYHLLSLNLDLSKILVPTRPRQNDYDMATSEGQAQYQDDLQEWKNMSSISGLFKSFGDAPGGFKEELQEIRFSLGGEYSYNDQFFVRAGYYWEHPNKGNRQYLGFGAGFQLKVVKLDASYMLATAASSPLDQTLRFTLSFDLEGIKDLFGRR